MMFDLPDFPYEELTETLKDRYNPDYLSFNNDATSEILSTNSNLVDVSEQMINIFENHLTFQSNESGRSFNIENATLLTDSNINEKSSELCIVQTENFINYETSLLDENTVNQFLLPLSDSTNNNKENENNGPDILALHSCAICHDLFTNDFDLLDHTIVAHASANYSDKNRESTKADHELINPTDFNLETEWLVCSICQRVLSTTDIELKEQLCCNGADGKTSVTSRTLQSMYVCEFCNGLFADADALEKHSLACYVENPKNVEQSNANNIQRTKFFPCEICGMQYESSEELQSHNVEHHKKRSSRTDRRPYSNNSNKMWNCGSCNQLFVTARELYRHKRGEDRPNGGPLVAYACEECDKVLGSVCALHTHTKMHKTAKPGYPCRICGRRFNQSGHLAIHMRMHTGERPYPCDLCPKAFKVKVERDDHRRTHTGERPFACAACPKTFTAAARLREHARIHTDQRPYRCDICGAAFRRPYARTVHTLIHTGEKPHECDVCGTAFRRSGDMWKHKRTLHSSQTISV